MPPFLVSLQETLPPDAFPWVVAALMHDALIWEALHGNVGQRALETFGSTPTAWQPAALAKLAAAEAQPPAEGLPLPPANLAEAALLAQALLQHRQESGHWQDLPAFLTAEGSDIAAWHTALACALAETDDAAGLLQALSRAPGGIPAALHALLCQPLPPEILAVRAAEFLHRLPPEQQAEALWRLHESRPDIAPRAAAHLPQTQAAPPYAAWQRAARHLATDQPEAAHQALSQAWEETRRLSGQIAAAQAHLATRKGDITTALAAWAQAAAALPERPEIAARHILALQRARRVEEAYSVLPEQPQHPALLVAAAALWQNRHPETAREHAHQALQQRTALPDDLLRTLAETLQALGSPAEAFQAARCLAHRRPTDLAALDLAAETALQARAWEDAAEAALLAYRAAPTTDRLRRLAQAQEAADLPNAALESRRALAAAPEATTEDRLALARLALRLNAAEEARAAVEAVLAETPDHAAALTLLGQIAMHHGDPAEARRYLEDAIAQRPNDAAPYLALAELLAQTEGHEAALSVLQTAAHALPQNAELHYRLGLHLLESRRPGHARTALETARRLAPARADIALALARTLTALGENAAAKELLQPLHQRHAAPEVARLLASVYLAEGQPAEAARLLAPLAQASHATPEDLLTYAQALLAAEEAPEHAAEALQTALTRLTEAPNPNPLLHADILAALAQAHRAANQPEAALEAYHQALHTLPEGYPKRSQAIARGLAETALALQRPEVALAAAEEALQQAPGNIHLRRLQAEAYRQLGFREQALDAAQVAFQMAERDPETLHWFARLAHELGASALAAEALESAPTAPDRHPELTLLHAEIYRSLERPDEARALLRAFVAESDSIAPAWCAEAGQHLLALGEPAEAARCLARAVHEPNAPLAWHLARVQALQAQEAYAEAIAAAEDALAREAAPDDEAARVDLHLAIVHNYLAQGETERAAAALQRAQETHPRAARLLASASTLWQVLGRHHQALKAAEGYLALHPDDLRMRARAAHLARIMLRDDAARRIIGLDADGEAGFPPVPAAADLLATAGELALENGEEVAAARWLAQALEIQPSSPRLLALQARLTAHRIDPQAGQAQFAAALESAPALDPALPSLETLAVWETLAETALALQMWPRAQALAEQLQQACPQSPAASLRVARVAVLAAEARHRCEALEARTGAPDAAALQEEAIAKWQSALANAARGLGLPPSPEGYAQHPALQRWHARGLAAFQNRLTEALLTPTHPDDVAAVLDVLRRHPLPSIVVPQQHAGHPLVSLHRALLRERLPGTDPDEALTAAENARRKRPHWGAAHFLVARIANRGGNLALASEAITAALNLNPAEPRWHALAAHIFTGLNQPEAALDHLRAALRQEPDHAPHYLALAQAYLQAQQPTEAESVLKQALAQGLESPQIHLLLAQTYSQMGKLAEAAHHADRAIRADRSAEEPVMLRIRIALAQHDAQTALQHARRWLQSHPHHPQAAIFAARALLALGEPAEALRVVEETLPHAAENMELNILQAELRHQVDGPKAAVKIWKALLASRPDAPMLWLGLAESLAAARKIVPAREAAHKALAHAEELSREDQVRLHLLLGNIAKDEGQLDQAIHHLSAARQLMPQHLEVLLKLGQVLHDRRQYAEALRAYEAAQQIAPADSRPYYFAGLTYKAVKDYERAEEMFREAANRAPNDIRIRRQLAAVSVVNIWQ